LPAPAEVDDLPDRYPANLFREWKRAQMDEYERVQRNWTLSDADAGRVLEASSPAVEQQHAGAVVGAVRAAERLALAARSGRAGPAARAAAWRAARARTRAAFSAWDQDGNPVYAEPSRLETDQLQAALDAAVDAAAARLVPLADDTKVELAAGRASRPAVRPWCDWVSRALDEVVDTSSAWPGPPGLEDDGRLENAVRGLAEATDGLAAAWRGEATAPPPEPSAAAADPVGDPDPLQAHRDLLDRARPFVRVDHRPYDAELRARLAAAAEDAAMLPPVLSTFSIDLTATCRLAAAVADDAELAFLAGQSSRRRPLCTALLLLEEAGRVAEERGRAAPAEHARAAFVALWDGVDWSELGSWNGNENYGATLFWTASRRTSPQHVREHLARALASRPDVVLRLVTARRMGGDPRQPGLGAARLPAHVQRAPSVVPGRRRSRRGSSDGSPCRPRAQRHGRRRRSGVAARAGAVARTARGQLTTDSVQCVQPAADRARAVLVVVP